MKFCLLLAFYGFVHMPYFPANITCQVVFFTFVCIRFSASFPNAFNTQAQMQQNANAAAAGKQTEGNYLQSLILLHYRV
jgi:hypothetical protein